MKRKILLYTVITITIILLFIIAYYLVKINNITKSPITDDYQMLSVKEIEDECTIFAEEYELSLLQTNASEEKVTPNTALVVKKHFKKCNHTLNEYLDVPQEIVNMNKKEVTDYFENWKVKEFSSNTITLYKEEDGNCNEHYLLKEKGGYIAVYLIDEDEKEVFEKMTEISIDCLTETDKNTIKNGIRANGREELNSTLEDFE